MVSSGCVGQNHCQLSIKMKEHFMFLVIYRSEVKVEFVVLVTSLCTIRVVSTLWRVEPRSLMFHKFCAFVMKCFLIVKRLLSHGGQGLTFKKWLVIKLNNKIT